MAREAAIETTERDRPIPITCELRVLELLAKVLKISGKINDSLVQRYHDILYHLVPLMISSAITHPPPPVITPLFSDIMSLRRINSPSWQAITTNETTTTLTNPSTNQTRSGSFSPTTFTIIEAASTNHVSSSKRNQIMTAVTTTHLQTINVVSKVIFWHP